MSRSSGDKKVPPPPTRKESPSPARKDSGSGFGFRKSSSLTSPLPFSITSSINSNVSKISSSPPKASGMSFVPSSPDGPTLRPSGIINHNSTMSAPDLSGYRTNTVDRSSSSPPILSSPNVAPADPLLRPADLLLRPSEPILRPSSSAEPARSSEAGRQSRLSITKSLIHKFPQIMEQMEWNIALLSRIIVHIKKVVATREALSLALTKEWGVPLPKAKLPAVNTTPAKKVSDSSGGRIRSISQTARPSSSAAPPPPYNSPPLPPFSAIKNRNPLPVLLQKMEMMAEQEGSQVANFCLQCKVAVLSPLERLKEAMEETKRKVEREEKERRLKFDEIKMRDELHRRKQKCLALWVNLQGLHKNRAGAAKIQKCLVVIQKKFVKYQQMVNLFNTTCETYYNAVPLLIQSVQKMEYERIDTMRNVLRQYSLLWHQLYAEPAKEAEAMLQLIDDPFSSANEQKDQWLESVSQQAATAKNWDGSVKSAEIPTATFDLPCFPEELIPGFGTDPTRGPYVHKFDTNLRAVLQTQQKETARKQSIDGDPRRLSNLRAFADRNNGSDDEVESKQPDDNPETPEGEEKGGDDPGQGELALAIYKQMFGCEPGELGHPILAESEDEDESSASSEEEDDDD